METITLSGSSDGIRLSAAVIAPAHPKAALVLVHGLAEHKERYFPLMTYLSEMGYACVIADLRGHGASAATPDDLGYFGKGGWQGLVNDTKNVVEYTRRQFPGLKIFLLGHSLGALIVNGFTQRNDRDIDGLVICGNPSRNPMAGPGVFLTRCIRLVKGDRYRSAFLEKLVTGSYDKKFRNEGLTNAWLSVNRANVQAYNNDPLCGFRFTVNGYRGTLQLLRRAYSSDGWEIGNRELPVHFIAGGNDPCIVSLKKFSQAVGFFRDRGYRRVTSKVYAGMRHEILNETGKETVWTDLASLLGSWQ